MYTPDRELDPPNDDHKEDLDLPSDSEILDAKIQEAKDYTKQMLGSIRIKFGNDAHLMACMLMNNELLIDNLTAQKNVFHKLNSLKTK